jgi:hypothetical protein
MSRLVVDIKQMTAFVEALFRYADEGTFATLRAFRDDQDGTWRAKDWPIIRLNGHGLKNLVEGAITFAEICANAPELVVFAPPVATFKTDCGAAEKDIANGLSLSVECDQRPAEARVKLTSVLGPPTIALASGGEWVNPHTGELQPKLHLHWRLARPTRAFAEHAALKEARRAAMILIGADATGVPLVHPMRWAGSWHRKGQPRLASILACNADIEIDISLALSLLKQARANSASAGQRASPAGSAAGNVADGGRPTAELITTILRGEDFHDPIARLAMRYLMGGMAASQVVQTLRGIMQAVDPGRRDYKGGRLHKDRWRSRYDDIPRAVSTARSKLGDQQEGQSEESARWTESAPLWPEPAPLLKDELETAPKFPVEFLPGPLSEFACDATDRMQCPVDIVAIPLIIGAATAIGKDFRLAPKAHDDWTERPCLWGGVILPSGQMKTPALQKGLRPIRLLEAEFHRQHEKEMKEYEGKLALADYREKCWKEASKRTARTGADMPERPELPVPPRVRRITTSDVTQESLIDLIEQNHRGLMLFRDQLSGWFSSFNQYRPGADRQFYLECHGGGAFPKDRRAGSAWVKDLYLNICGGVQPDIVRSVLAGGDRDGMAARFSLLVYPDRFEGFNYIDRRPNLTAERAVEDLFKKLIKLDPEAFFGPDKPAALRAFRFDDQAQQIFVEWYTKNQQRIRNSNETGGFTAHLSKFAGLFARLSIVHHLIRYALGKVETPMLVDEITALAVERFIDDYLEPQARRIYWHLSTDPIRDKARRVAQWIADSPALANFTARDIRQKDWSGLTDQDSVNRALDYLENVAGWVRCTDSLSGPKGGRPTTKYLVNPLIRRNGHETPFPP